MAKPELDRTYLHSFGQFIWVKPRFIPLICPAKPRFGHTQTALDDFCWPDLGLTNVGLANPTFGPPNLGKIKDWTSFGQNGESDQGLASDPALAVTYNI